MLAIFHLETCHKTIVLSNDLSACFGVSKHSLQSWFLLNCGIAGLALSAVISPIHSRAYPASQSFIFSFVILYVSAARLDARAMVLDKGAF